MTPELDLDHPLAPLLRLGSGTADESLVEVDARPLFPWEDKRLSPWPSLGRTLRGVLFNPSRFFRGHRSGSGSAAPFIFGLAAGTTGLMLSFFRPALTALLLPTPPGRITPDNGTGVAGTAALIFLAPLLVLVGMILQALWSHFWLIVFRAGSNGLEATTRALSYSMAAALFIWLPTVGPLLGSIWGLTIYIMALSILQGRGTLRIGLALFGPPLAIHVLFAYLGGGFG